MEEHPGVRKPGPTQRGPAPTAPRPARSRLARAAGIVPATYDQVIAVTAFADFDGQAGGLDPTPPCSTTHVDDRYAAFSNDGPDVDLAAPGVCVHSNLPNGSLGYKTGTSMAAPYVAGCAALVREWYRVHAGWETPSAALIDSQSVKTTPGRRPRARVRRRQEGQGTQASHPDRHPWTRHRCEIAAQRSMMEPQRHGCCSVPRSFTELSDPLPKRIAPLVST